MKKIYLHIGMPKCASSAIQETLSSATFADNNQKILYVSIEKDGTLLYGKRLIESAKKSPLEYSSTVAIQNLLKLPDNIIKELYSQLKQLSKKHDTIIISNEGFGVYPAEVNDFFSKLFCDNFFNIEIIAIIRSQVAWFNSAWWQWGVWTGHSIEEWINHTLQNNEANWYKKITKYKHFDWVKKVHTFILDKNIIENFLNTIGSKPLPVSKANTTSDLLLIKFLYHNRKYRKDAHHPQYEFILAKNLIFNPQTKPCALDKNHIKKIIDFYQRDNMNLVKYLDDQEKEKLIKTNYFSTLDNICNKVTSLKFTIQDKERFLSIINKVLTKNNVNILKINSYENEAELDALLTQAVDEIIRIDTNKRHQASL